MEKYIIIAHPKKFVCEALAAFFKQKNQLSYVLESDDDLQFRIEDLNPKALIIHPDFTHNEKNSSEIVELFNVLTYWVGENAPDGAEIVPEPFDPQAVVSQVCLKLESH